MESRDTTDNQQSLMSNSPLKILCIYTAEQSDTPRDMPFYQDLKRSLILWERQGHISWLESKPGDDLERIMQEFLQQAHLILFLLSSDFFVSDACYMAMKAALQEREKRQVQVVPILARPVNWQDSACKHLKVLPDNEQPIVKWSLKDDAYANIRHGLAHLLPGLSTPSRSHLLRPRLFQARDLPKSYVSRSKAFGQIKHLLLDRSRGNTTTITTALRGAGGFGKTTLALALCHDPDIQAAFPDGILWVELGEHPPTMLDILNNLLASMENSHDRAVTLEEAQDRWRAALSDRVYLLVIDDVWQIEILEPLLEGGSQCARLITTRNDQLLPEEAQRVLVDAMEPEEAVAALNRGLLTEDQQISHHPRLIMLVERLGCWPLLLTLARGLLADQIRYGRTFSQALDVVEQAYQRYGVTAFHIGNASKRQQTADACLEISIRHLDTFMLARYQAATRYQELAIFPENTDIPMSTLRIFWNGTGGLEGWETEELCVYLHRLSLLLSCDLSKGTIRLHNVLHSYLVQRATSDLSLLHSRFLDISKQAQNVTRWAQLSPDNFYLWHFLVYHLQQAGRSEELYTVLMDLEYLARKALYTSLSALEIDLLQASKPLPFSGSGSPSPFITSTSEAFIHLHRVIARWSHVLWRANTPHEMSGLLLSYMAWESPFSSRRSLLEQTLPRPSLTAWHPLTEGASRALLRTLQGHSSSVIDCAVSPNGKWIVSASDDGTLKVWDTNTGAETRSLDGHEGCVYGCTISPDGKWIVSASDDGTLKVWDFNTGAEHASFHGHTGWVYGCAVNSDGKWIVSTSSDQTLKMWDLDTKAELFSLQGHTGPVNSCAISPDGKWIVSASDDRTLKIWNVNTGGEILSLQGHTASVNSCAISPDGKWIVSASDDRTLKIWDANTGDEIHSLHGHTSWVRSCAISPNGKRIVSASDDQTLKIWDASTGEELLSLRGHSGLVYSCAVSFNGKWIVSASDDRTLKIWDASIGDEHSSLYGHTGWVYGCAISPDGKWIVSASDDHTLKVWGTNTGDEHFSLYGHTSWVYDCAISPDGKWIVSASNDRTLKIWDAGTGDEIHSLHGHTGSVYSCAISPDGKWIVSASDDRTLKIWDADTGDEIHSLHGHTSWVRSCAVSSDGKWIVSASDDSILKIWDANTGDELLSLRGHNGSVYDCAISPDGKWIVSVSFDQTLKIWDTHTGNELLSLYGHTDAVNSCAVSLNGKWIISVSRDKTLKVWDSQTGHCILTFPVDGSLYGCVFHPDGEHLVACGSRGVYFLRLIL